MGPEIAIAAAIAGGAISAYGSVSGGEASKNAANYRATVARNNAEYTKQAGQAQADAQSRKINQVYGKQEAAMGTTGVQVGGGSFGTLSNNTANLGQLDMAMILNRAANKAMGLEQEATLEEFSGEQAQKEGYLKAATSILSSVSSVSSKWDGYKAKGIDPFSFDDNKAMSSTYSSF